MIILEILNSIKEIILDYVKHRLFPITVLIVVMFFILVRRLFVLQIIEGDKHVENFTYKSQKTLTIESVRGNIKDRNGKLLAYNELSYSVIFSNDPNLANIAASKGMEENDLKNEILYKTINILETNNDELYVDFPIELLDSGEYKFTIKDTALKNFLKNVYSVTTFDELSDERKNSSANDIVNYLSNEVFDIAESYTPDARLKILACRYKLWMNRYQQYVPVTIAYDISEHSNAALNEHSDELIGIDVSVKALRRYNDAEYFAHIIGYIGGISDEELKTLNEGLDPSNAYVNGEMVGKTGIEQYCEKELRGATGYEIMYVDNLGKVLETVESKPAEAGNDVYLTIDADLQKYCYDSLEKEIASIILSNLENSLDVKEEENAKIPISDVYYGLFNNNYLSIYDMAKTTASDLEKNIYSNFTQKKESTINNINNILTTQFTPLSELSPEYQNYMEYICEILSANNIFNTSMIPYDDEEYVNYTSGLSSLEHYLKYAISIEAIDISALNTESNYYDTDEIYNLLCEYIIEYLNLDTEFDKQIVQVMLKSSEISGADVVHLLYYQGVLDETSDKEYSEFKNGKYDAFEFMVRKIRKLDITPAMLALSPCSGSVIVTDVTTGDLLAFVSYPSYDNNYLTNEIDSEYYNKLLEDKTTPLYNRASQQRTAPGSTYKILTSIAGITEGVISQDSYVSCIGSKFDKVTPSPQCWAYPGGHGGVEVETALQNSCNMYFYEVGYQLGKKPDDSYSDAYGLERLSKYAKLFGFGDYSGVELPESSPQISDNDVVRSAIGQGKNSYTPVQLSRYVTTIANSGTCYNLTLIDKVTDYEGNLINDNHATVLNQINDVKKTTWSSVHSGMRRVVSIDTPDSELINKVNVSVAGKSGTAQETETKPNHALFISYAPYETPEVSVTCVIQNGYSSGNARELVGFIYAYMYDPEKLVGAEMQGNTTVSD